MVGPKTQKNTPARQAAQKKYNAKPEQIKRRASRNAARREMIKAGHVSKGDGKDVAHKSGNPMQNAMFNLAAQSPSKNRSVAKTSSNKKKYKNG